MTRESFLSAVREYPADDGPRLVYADWLDERGEADRARFIRLQCELARCGPPHKLYTHTSAFYFRRGQGDCAVYGDPVEVGDRIDLTLTRDERDGKRYKRDWHGLLVTSAHRLPSPGGTGVSFVMDEQSDEWPGARLRRESADLFMRAAGDCVRDRTPFWEVPWPVHKSAVPVGRAGDPAVECLLPSGGGVRLDYRRGFPEFAILARAKDFYGEHCDWCNGTGNDYDGYKSQYHRDCDVCVDGRVGGVARELFSTAPITDVRLLDRVPTEGRFYRPNDPDWEFQDKPFWMWLCDNDGRPARPDHLPHCVYKWLTGSVSPWHKQYLSREDAHNAHSRALVAYGRHAARMSPIFVTTPVSADP